MNEIIIVAKATPGASAKSACVPITNPAILNIRWVNCRPILAISFFNSEVSVLMEYFSLMAGVSMTPL